MSINLPVPYFSQIDNEIDPFGTCGATCSAMCLKYFEIPDVGPMPQFEDDIKRRFDGLGIDHGAPDGIKRVVEGLGLRDDLTLSGKLSQITRALDNGQVCILHGFWTLPGHIIVIRGYTANGDFIVNDPNGEFFRGGYRKNSMFEPDNKGENKVYSRRLISTAGNAFSLREAFSFYDTWNSDQIESTATMWLHRISK
jgi:Peptidase_C39 like family